MDIREHLLIRGMPLDTKGLLIDDDNCIATFLLYNLSGQIVGYQQYNPRGSKQIRNDIRHRDLLKYFTYAGDEGEIRKTGKKKIAIWGIHTLSIDVQDVYLTEGIFDAVKLINIGLSAIAVLGNDPEHLKTFLKCLGKRIIAVCDHDQAGLKLAKLATHTMSIPSEFHDLGEMSHDDITAWFSTAQINANTRFSANM